MPMIDVYAATGTFAAKKELVKEALLDNVGRIVAAEHPGASGWEEGLPATS